jgi:hypothetical protein
LPDTYQPAGNERGTATSNSTTTGTTSWGRDYELCDAEGYVFSFIS